MTKKRSSRASTDVDSAPPVVVPLVSPSSPRLPTVAEAAFVAEGESSPTEPRVTAFDPRDVAGELGSGEDVESKTEPLVVAVRPARVFEDDRPTELYEPARLPQLQETREQCLMGTAIHDILAQPDHRLKGVLERLVDRAIQDLPSATLDVRSSLMLRHQFEFDRRIGYQLRLTMFDASTRQSVEVSEEVDQDGRSLRRDSLVSRLLGL
ncbi:MAG: hypothetical protein H6729_14105 [Deltaproteobacteria bacterium]|nr:hypothetical protein [Deltaproteobacteria bacterium]